jgi:alcohol dehydrogenase class IV
MKTNITSPITGSIEQLKGLKALYKPNKTLLVTGKKSFMASGAKALIDTCFNADEIVHFNDFEVNPRLEDALKGAQLAIDNDIDCIIAVGGGSTLDIAKLIKAFLSHSLSKQASINTSSQITENKIAASKASTGLIELDADAAKKIVRGENTIPDCPIPLIAIPTTAGSGSEATHFAVAYIGKQKYSVASPVLFPTAIILDGSFLASASSYQKAVNGLDALAQAIEGYWAVSSCQESRGYSLNAIELLVKHLPHITTNEDNGLIHLNAVMEAAHLAGKVINFTKTTAPHAFSYGFTSYYNVPHGHAVWLTLPRIFQLHCTAQAANLNDERGHEYFQKIMADLCELLNIKEPNNAEQVLQKFMVDIGVEPSMAKMGATSKEQRLFIAQQVNPERLANNPLKLSDEHIKFIFDL